MDSSILLRASGETADGIRELVERRLPTGFSVGKKATNAKGLNVEPITIALVGAGGAIVASLIQTLGLVWVEHVKKRDAKAIPTVTVSTHSREIVVRLVGGDIAAAIAAANVPAELAEVVEISLESE